MSEAAIPSALSSHPIGLIVTDDLRRSRLTVFLRLILVIPHLVVLYVYNVLAEIALVIAWFVALVAGRLPAGLHTFLSAYLRYSTRVNAYVLLLANPWPPLPTVEAVYPVDVRIDPPERQNRLTVLFRLVLLVPAALLTAVFRTVNMLVAFFGWFYVLATGRMNQGMRDLSAWLFRYETQTFAYLFLLTDRYPSLSGAPTA